MTRQGSLLQGIYDVEGSDALRRYYDDWAERYDEDLTRADYRTPTRCAEALARHASDQAAPVLDFACGTGLSGKALRAAGFSCIDGTDVAPGMLRQAEKRDLYRHLLVGHPDRPLDLRDRGYAAIVASGAIGAGAAPADCIDWALDTLAPGGLFVLSLNDHSMDDPVYAGRLNRATDAGRITVLEDQDGPHLPAMGLNARVFVLRRL